MDIITSDIQTNNTGAKEASGRVGPRIGESARRQAEARAAYSVASVRGCGGKAAGQTEHLFSIEGHLKEVAER
jgi:hypothetical protein